MKKRPKKLILKSEKIKEDKTGTKTAVKVDKTKKSLPEFFT